MNAKWQQQENEIIWNVVNSLLAGLLVFLGSLTSGNITADGILAATITALIIAITKFRDYWKEEESEYSGKRRIAKKAFAFIN